MVVDRAVLSDAGDLRRQVRMRVGRRRRSGPDDAPSTSAAASPTAAAAGRHEERVGGRAPQFEAFLEPSSVRPSVG